MKSFWNFLRKNRLYGAVNLVGLTVSMAFVLLLAVYVRRQLSTVNLVGLTVSMAFVLLLAVYVRRQLSTDSFQENAE